METIKKKKVNKYYRDAYNNPSQYKTELLLANITDKNREVVNNIIQGVTDAYRDRQLGTYKFIL